MTVLTDSLDGLVQDCNNSIANTLEFTAGLHLAIELTFSGSHNTRC